MHVLGYRIQPLVFAGLAVGAAVGSAVAHWSRRRAWNVVRRTGLAGGTFTAVVVVSIALAPSTSLAAVPGCTVRLPDSLASWGSDQRVLNAAMYAPLGLALSVTTLTSRQLIAGLTALTGLALGTEYLQSLSAIGRSCDTVDVIDNILGAMSGLAIGLPFRCTSFRSKPGLD